MTCVIGWDIGGAHIKAARARNGRLDAIVQRACAPHLGFSHLECAIQETLEEFGRADRHHITMTAELSDAFPNRSKGVEIIASLMARLTCVDDVLFYTSKSEFVSFLSAKQCAPLIASANWRISADFIAQKVSSALFIDMGSTCEQQYSNIPSLSQSVSSDSFTRQSWRLQDFAPVFEANIDDLIQDNEGLVEKLARSKGTDAVDYVAVTAVNINGTSRQDCMKLHVAIFTDVSTHPNIDINFFRSRGSDKINNPVMLDKFLKELKDAEERRIREGTRSLCDVSLNQELCETMLRNSGEPCAVDPTGVYRAGFSEDVIFSRNSRYLTVNITKNPRGGANYVPTDAEGYVYLEDVEAGFLTGISRSVSATIVYPITTSSTYTDYYSGIMTSTVRTENRSPEITEIYGKPTNKRNNNSLGVRIINNTVDPDIVPVLDPNSRRFLKLLNVVTGDGQQLKTVEEYHNFVSSLNAYQPTEKTRKVELSVAGSPSLFGAFKRYINPAYGLTSFSVTLDDSGINTELSFANRPPTLPAQESILNKIGPRLKK